MVDDEEGDCDRSCRVGEWRERLAASRGGGDELFLDLDALEGPSVGVFDVWCSSDRLAVIMSCEVGVTGALAVG